MNNYIVFLYSEFKTHHCMYSGEDHVPVGVLLFSMQARGHRGEGRVLFTPSSSTSHPWENLLACYLLLYLHLSSSMSWFQPIFVSCVTILLPYVTVPGHVACQNFALTVLSTESSSCGGDHENDPTSRRSIDQRLKYTSIYFAGVWKPCGDTLSVLTLTMSMCGRVLRIWLSRPS